MSDSEKITPATIKFPHDGAPPEGSAGRSLINEVDQLKKAVLLLCDVQRGMMGKLDVALNPINGWNESSSALVTKET